MTDADNTSKMRLGEIAHFALALPLAQAPAFAQDDEEDQAAETGGLRMKSTRGYLVVTGSLIQRPNTPPSAHHGR